MLEPNANDFETIVKVDKMTEEKLIRSSIDGSASKKHVYRTSKSSKVQAAINFEGPDEPINSPPQAVSAPKNPRDSSVKSTAKQRTATHKP